jgi:hypothetical protein
MTGDSASQHPEPRRHVGVPSSSPERVEGGVAAMAQTNANLIWKIADLLRGRISPTSTAM